MVSACRCRIRGCAEALPASQPAQGPFRQPGLRTRGRVEVSGSSGSRNCRQNDASEACSTSPSHRGNGRAGAVAEPDQAGGLLARFTEAEAIEAGKIRSSASRCLKRQRFREAFRSHADYSGGVDELEDGLAPAPAACDSRCRGWCRVSSARGNRGWHRRPVSPGACGRGRNRCRFPGSRDRRERSALGQRMRGQ